MRVESKELTLRVRDEFTFPLPLLSNHSLRYFLSLLDSRVLALKISHSLPKYVYMTFSYIISYPLTLSFRDHDISVVVARLRTRSCQVLWTLLPC